MKNLFFITIPNMENYKIFKKITYPPMKQEFFKKYVLPSSIYNSKTVSFWGINKTEENFKIWKKIKLNDLVLFRYDDKYILQGTVVKKIIDEKIFSNFTNERKRELLIFFNYLKVINIDFEKTIPLLINPLMNNFYNFPILDLKQKQKKFLIKNFGTLQNAINYIENNFFSPSVNFSMKTISSKVRIGQNKFSKLVLKNFNYTCAICNTTQSEILQGAHIIPVIDLSKAGQIKNGLCLCVLCHKLFDEGVISINDNLTIIFSKNKEISPITKKLISENSLIAESKIKPSLDYLRLHRIKNEIL